MRAENIEGLGENVIVDEAGVDGEASHHGDDVTTSKEDLEDLRSLGFRLQHSLLSTRRSTYFMLRRHDTVCLLFQCSECSLNACLMLSQCS